MLKLIAALVLGAILLPAAAALAEGMDRGDILTLAAPIQVQSEPLYLSPINEPQVDASHDRF